MTAPTITAHAAVGGWRQRVSRSIFPVAPAERWTPRRVLLAVVAVLAGTAVSLARTRGPGAFDTMWAEDGNEFYNDALNEHVWDTLFKGLNGYFVVLPRLIAEVAVRFPISWGPAMMSTGAALTTAVFALAAYLGSGAHLRSTALRLLVAAPVVACPTGGLSTPNNVATLQFVALYAAFWMLLWTPSTRLGRAFAVTLVLLIGLTTILTIVVIPLALLRLFVVRDRWSLALCGAVFGTVVLQVVSIPLGLNSRHGISEPRLDPVWAIYEFFAWAVPYSIIGERWLAPPINRANCLCPVVPAVDARLHGALIILAFLVVVVALFLAFRRVTRPVWGLAVVAGAQSLITLAVEVMSYGHAYRLGTHNVVVPEQYFTPEIMMLGTIRYLVPVTLMIIAAITALLVPRRASEAADAAVDRGAADRRRRWINAAPVLGYAALVVLICVVNLRPITPRMLVPSWSAELAKSRAECVATGAQAVRLNYGGEWWWPWVTVPCKRLS